MKIPQEIRLLIESGHPAHLVLSIAMVALKSPSSGSVWRGTKLSPAHLPRNRKVRNIERDPRVAISLEATTKSAMGLTEYAVEVSMARAFLDLGMGKGPLMAYLLADPVLSLPSILVVSRIMGTRRTVAYVGLIIVFTVIGGYLFGLSSSR